MRELRDRAVILAHRPYGEDARLYLCLTQHHGLVRGMMRGIQLLDSGARVLLKGNRRQDDGLFQLTFELLGGASQTQAPALVPLFARLVRVLPPFHPYPALYEGLGHVLSTHCSALFSWAMLWFQLLMLRELGYGIQLSSQQDASETTLFLHAKDQTWIVPAVFRDLGASWLRFKEAIFARKIAARDRVVSERITAALLGTFLSI